jgi:ligand-binding sensor domain-containing protein/signal transduction histidine kinase
MNRTWFIALWLFLGLIVSSKAQTVPLRFEHLTSNQGLSNHIIYDILQDRQGYLWFATENGLNKYDGYSITTYHKTPGDTTSLAGNAVPQLFADIDGDIWVGMMGQGICRFDRRTEKFTCYAPHPLTLNQGTIHTMAQDQAGYIWVSNGRAELRTFNKQTGEYSRINYADRLAFRSASGKIVPPIINTIYGDRKGAIWLCSDKGLYRMTSKSAGKGKSPHVSFKAYRHNPADARSLPHNQVWEAFEDHAGGIWVSTDKGLCRFDPQTQAFTLFLCSLKSTLAIGTALNQHFRYLTEDQQGNLWMGIAHEGMFRLDPKRRQFTQLMHDPVDPFGLSSNHVRSLYIDRSGLLWVGTFGEGIDKANPNQQPFRYYRPVPFQSNSLSYKFVSAILEDRSGTLWVGTGNGLNRMNRQTGEFAHYQADPGNPKGLPFMNVEAMLEDRDGNLWVGSKGELVLFNRKTGEFTCLSKDTLRYPGLSGNTQLFFIYQDKPGLLWLGTHNGVKSFNPKTGKVVHYAYDPQNAKGISDGFAMSMLEDNRGNLWIGTGSVALNRLDRRTGRFTYYRPDRNKPGSITSDGVPSIFQDSKGNLWFGTLGGGLCRFDYSTERFQAFTQADGLADNSVFSIEEDDQGYLWLATSKGLSRFSVADRTFTNYDENDGLQSNGFRQAHCKGKDGMLYFGGDNGFTAFDPRRLTTNRHIPPVVITQVKLFDKAMPGKMQASQIDLNYNENFLSFEFAALDYNNPSKNRYAYQLVGLETDWVKSGARRFVSYTNLDPGTYTFRVKGSNNDGVWNENGAVIQLVIHPPWWRTTWFRLLAVVSLVLLVGASIRFYTRDKLRRQRSNMKRVLQAQEEERQRLAADLHDDLGATLSVIKGQLQTLHQPFDGLDAPIQLMEKAIVDLRHISHHLMPPEFVKLGLTEAIREIVRRAEASSAINFLFISFGQERRLDNETELTIYRIAVELINNAIKHAKARQITVQLIFYPQYVSLLVEDDGRGYSSVAGPEQMGIGLRNIRSRVTYLQAKLIVDSGEGGTTITLEVPY